MARTDTRETDTTQLKTIGITDPGVNASVSTEILDTYSGVIITTTTTGNAQTLQDPTNTDLIKRFSVVNNDTSTNTISINGTDLAIGEKTDFIWDGTAWTNQGGGGTPGDTLPVVDTTPIVKGSVDATKLVRIEADGITTGTTRVITMPDANVDLADVNDLPVANLADGTDGELITWDSSGVPATVGAGTAAQVLTSNGVGAAPTFEDAGGGGNGALAGLTAGFTIPSAFSWTLLPLDTVTSTARFDTGGNFNTGTNRYVVDKAGIYTVNASAMFTNASVNIQFGIAIYINGTQCVSAYNCFGSSDTSATIGANLNLALNDYVQVYVYHRGATRTISNNAVNTYLSIS